MNNGSLQSRFFVKFWRGEWRRKFFSIPLSKRGESIAPYKKKPKKLNLGGKLRGE